MPNPTTTEPFPACCVRHPQARDISHFFHFEVARKNKKPDDFTAFRDTALKNRGHQTTHLKPSVKGGSTALQPNDIRQNEAAVARLISRILKHYDFVGLTERMTESLAVMTLLWDLDPTDVIVFAAKQSGSYDTGGWRNRCIMTQKAFLTEENRNFLLSPNYVTGHADFLLYVVCRRRRIFGSHHSRFGSKRCSGTRYVNPIASIISRGTVP
jgi:hypothetical protein